MNRGGDVDFVIINVNTGIFTDLNALRALREGVTNLFVITFGSEQNFYCTYSRFGGNTDQEQFIFEGMAFSQIEDLLRYIELNKLKDEFWPFSNLDY